MINATGTDLVLLSQGATTGTLEGDSSVGWNDTAGTSKFTLSPTLEASLNMYRCGVHTGSMRGPVSIQTR